MKYLFTSVLSCIAYLTWAQSDQENSAGQLSELITTHRYAIEISGGNLVGQGFDVILADGQQADIFMLGENHGMKEIAELSQILYQELSQEAPRILVTEIGPTTAYQTERMIRDGQFESFLAEKTNLMSVPFFFLEQEVPLLYHVAEKFPENKQSIWGLDQEFLAGIPVVSKRLSELAKTTQEKGAVDTLNRRNFLNPFLIGYSDGSAFLALQKAFSQANSEGERIAQQLIHSNEIYKANSDGRGRWSNETRETLMMENFEYYVDHYDGILPSLFFRFGGYHLHKGSSPTVKEALGLRIDNWASEQQKRTINVFVDAAHGQTIHPLLGTTTESPGNKTWEKTIFQDYLLDSQATLFDLRPLKGHPETKPMSNRIRHMLNGYDYLILFKSGSAQNYMPGTLITYGYGIPIAFVTLLLIALLIFVLIKVIKRVRQK
jgi:hypothetical protein